MKKSQLSTSGLSLLELLVSVSAIAVVSTLMAQVFFTTTKVNRTTIRTQDIKQNGDYALEVITRMVRNSHEFTYTCDPSQTKSETVSFVNPDLNSTTITCESNGGTARIASVSADGTTKAYLTGTTVTLSASGGSTCTDSTLAFSCDPVTSSGALTVSYTLTAIGAGVNPEAPEKLSFTTSVNSRNLK